MRISPELHQKIAKKAADAGVSLNNWVLTKLEQGVI
ncbi:MAG: toxin-antitoxin system HicB family antitoxin [Bilophila wadsworthia]